MLIRIDSVHNHYVEFTSDEVTGPVKIELQFSEIGVTLITEHTRFTFDVTVSAQDMVRHKGVPDYKGTVQKMMNDKIFKYTHNSK